MSEKRLNVFVPLILFVVLNLQTCFGNYECYQMSPGKDICFMFDGIKQTFEDSKKFCRNNGGFLLEIYNNEMQTFVETFVKNKSLSFVEAWLNLVRTNSNEWNWGGENTGWNSELIEMNYKNIFIKTILLKTLKININPENLHGLHCVEFFLNSRE